MPSNSLIGSSSERFVPLSQYRVGYALFNNVLNPDVMLQNTLSANVPFQEWINAIATGAINRNLDRTFKLEEVGKAREYHGGK